MLEAQLCAMQDMLKKHKSVHVGNRTGKSSMELGRETADSGSPSLQGVGSWTEDVISDRLGR